MGDARQLAMLLAQWNRTKRTYRHLCVSSLHSETDSWTLIKCCGISSPTILPLSLSPAFISCEDLGLCSLHLLPWLEILLLGSFNLPRPIITHRKCLCKPVGLDFSLKGRVHLFFGLNHAYKVVLIQLTEKKMHNLKLLFALVLKDFRASIHPHFILLEQYKIRVHYGDPISPFVLIADTLSSLPEM